MPATTIQLDAEQVQTLEGLAAADGQSVPDLLQRAVSDYLDRRRFDREDPMTQFAILAKRIQARLPPDITPEEIEAEITLAREEVRQARRAAREYDAIVARVQASLPPDITREDIEAEITLAREEVRQARRAARGH